MTDTKYTLYTSGCPKCKVLAAKMEQAGISFDIETDLSRVIDEGFKTLPVLFNKEANSFMSFVDAIKHINSI